MTFAQAEWDQVLDSARRNEQAQWAIARAVERLADGQVWLVYLGVSLVLLLAWVVLRQWFEHHYHGEG